MTTHDKKIPPAPKKMAELQVQSLEERIKRLSDWEFVLGQIPFCNFEKNSCGLIGYDPSFLRDNADFFGPTTFILCTRAETIHLEYEYAILYFLFMVDGSFKIFRITEDNGKGVFEEPISKAIHDLPHYEAETWEQGYHFTIEILQKIWGSRYIQESPR